MTSFNGGITAASKELEPMRRGVARHHIPVFDQVTEHANDINSLHHVGE